MKPLVPFPVHQPPLLGTFPIRVRVTVSVRVRVRVGVSSTTLDLSSVALAASSHAKLPSLYSLSQN